MVVAQWRKEKPVKATGREGGAERKGMEGYLTGELLTCNSMILTVSKAEPHTERRGRGLRLFGGEHNRKKAKPCTL